MSGSEEGSFSSIPSCTALRSGGEASRRAWQCSRRLRFVTVGGFGSGTGQDRTYLGMHVCTLAKVGSMAQNRIWGRSGAASHYLPT